MKTRFSIGCLGLLAAACLLARAGAPPSISAMAAQTTEPSVSLTVSFSVADAETPAVNDYNQDGRPDLLFQHTNGNVGLWYLNGLTLDRATSFRPVNPGAGWRVAGPK